MTAQPSLIGRTLRDGEYLVREVLGRGGMATVYRAYSRSLETDVALKVLAPEMAVNLELRERFHQEARLLSRLFHPNLLTVHYFGEEGDVVYIAMRLVRGGTLRDRLIAVGGTLDLVTAARMVHGVADALQAAHDAKVVHLDVKPSNVLLGRADWPLLADTGIAEVIEPAAMTGKRRVAGTPAYMSPEQCRGEAVDGSSDQYSLAVMAYELLTGRVPFMGSDADEIMRRHIEDAPPRPRVFNPGLPSPIEDILLRGLAKDPADRFPTVADFGRTLSEAAEHTRGMSLETKQSLADAAPNIAGLLALLVLGPLLLLMLPGAGLIGGRVPLVWPFQLALAAGLSALLLGIRWHVVGLFVRAGNALVDAVERARAGPARVRPRLAGLRHAVVGSAEGVVNLLYVFGLYRLIGTPLIGLLGSFADPTLVRGVSLALLAAAIVAALIILVAISRTAGFKAAAVVLALAWALTSLLSANDLGLTDAAGILNAVRLLVAAALIAVIVARRGPTAQVLGRVAADGLGRLMLESRDDVTLARAAANRRRLALVVGCVLDLIYLLLAYALLRTPLTDELQVVAPVVVAATLVTAVAAMVWLVLIVRMQVLAGALGVLLGLLLGAPLLLSLPLLDGRLVGDVPTIASTAVAWVVGVALLLLLIGMRSRFNHFGRPALGGRLDRGLLGTHSADDEASHARRQGAFGRIVGALIDVVLLVLAYWILGVPIAAALVRSTGYEWIGTAALAVLLAAVVAVLGVAVLQSRRALDETGGAAWRARATAFGVLCLLLLPLVAVTGAAAPAALAMPAAAGALELQPTRAPMLIVDQDFWLPYTPGQTQATHELELSCTDGTTIGDFRETIKPGDGAVMPAGQVGSRGRTDVPCASWPVEYAARRQAAGLGDAASQSWDGLNVSATLNPDNSVDVVETHRVLFTAGSHDHVLARVGAPAGDLTNLKVSEGGVTFATDPATPEPRYATSWEDDEQYWVEWFFPSVDSPSEHTYTVAYHLNNAVMVTPDSRKALDWQVVPPDPLQPIWLATVQLDVGGDVQPDSVHLQASGDPVQSGLLGGPSAWFTAASAIASQPLVTSVDFPAGDAPPPPTPTPAATPSPTPTSPPEPTATSVPSATPTSVPTDTPTDTPTEAPADEVVVPTDAPTPGQPRATPVQFRPSATATPVVTLAQAQPTDTPEPEATDDPGPPTPEPGPTPADTDVPTPQPSPTDVVGDTPTSIPPTSTPVPSTPTPPPLVPTDTPVPPPTNTPVPPTPVPPPPTNTPVPPTDTPVPPTSTPVPPTSTPVPPTNTPVPPTNTPVPPTNTPVPPTNTPVPPTNTPRPPTNTPVPPTNTPRPTATPTSPPIFVAVR
ncbi:MAG: serine/threonine protein kinase [Chloroflexi bacterium]|nr:serine/threonine protein kinase [Chloroflexota bacterium]